MTSNGNFSGRQLSMQPISRRRFGGGLVAGGFMTAAGSLLKSTGATAAPTRGGTLRIALASQSTNDTFNSARYVYGNDYIRGTSVYSYLTRLEAHGRTDLTAAEAGLARLLG